MRECMWHSCRWGQGGALLALPCPLCHQQRGPLVSAPVHSPAVGPEEALVSLVRQLEPSG